MKRDFKLYWKLFTSTFYISAFTFGGGLVIVSLLKKKFVDNLKWLEEKEILDYTAIAQSSPGIIAVNTAILIGYRIGGILGALMTILGTIIPPFIIISIISTFYNAYKDNEAVNAVLKCMQAGVAAVIISIMFDLGKNVAREKNIAAWFIMAAAFALVFFFNVNVIFVLIGGGIIGYVSFYIARRKKTAKDTRS